MFAVIKTGGRQYRVVPDDVLEIGKIAGDVGSIVQLGEVLLVGGDQPVLGAPTVAGASVAAEEGKGCGTRRRRRRGAEGRQEEGACQEGRGEARRKEGPGQEGRREGQKRQEVISRDQDLRRDKK